MGKVDKEESLVVVAARRSRMQLLILFVGVVKVYGFPFVWRKIDASSQSPLHMTGSATPATIMSIRLHNYIIV